MTTHVRNSNFKSSFDYGSQARDESRDSNEIRFVLPSSAAHGSAPHPSNHPPFRKPILPKETGGKSRVPRQNSHASNDDDRDLGSSLDIKINDSRSGSEGASPRRNGHREASARTIAERRSNGGQQVDGNTYGSDIKKNWPTVFTRYATLPPAKGKKPPSFSASAAYKTFGTHARLGRDISYKSRKITLPWRRRSLPRILQQQNTLLSEVQQYALERRNRSDIPSVPPQVISEALRNYVYPPAIMSRRLS
jgi:hypothetical protein